MHSESDDLAARREAVLQAEKSFAAGTPSGPGGRWGLCLSGGGIRSATFALGVVQALTRTPAGAASPLSLTPTTFAGSLLSRFDYLSTVSGGGYTGSFVASLFIPGRLVRATDAHAAADAAVVALTQDPPGRITSGPGAEAASVVSFPLAWLRENGRYLSPTGAGDLAYAAALDLRNWLAVHYVVGTVLVVVFAVLAFFRGLLADLWPLERLPVDGVMLWTSPILWLALLPLLLWAMPVGLAFWFTYPGRARVAKALNWAVGAAIGIDAVLALLLATAWITGQPVGARIELVAVGVLVLSLSLLHHAWLWRRRDRASPVTSMRVLTTRSLLSALQWTAGLLALGMVETLGQTLYLMALTGSRTRSIGGATALAAVLTWIAKHLISAASPEKLPGWLGKVPLTAIGGAVGIVIFALLGCLWSCFVTALAWDGQWPSPDGMSTVARGLVALTAIGLAWVTGQFPGFINLSSLQAFYSARLTRAYLGASNGARVGADANDPKLSAAEPVPGDDVFLSDYAGSGDDLHARTLAPFHLINTTLNKTVDPSEQLVQRDRKGQPLAVSPIGFQVDGHFNAFHEARGAVEIQKTLSVGGWVGVSGAAASTGIGRNTALGLSLLLGAANVRLGSWWESQAHGAPRRERGWLRSALRTQAYLMDEFTAKFHGLDRPWQYLTDGGHFENTALYELLRPERRLCLAVVVDAGADPDYGFGDLANLIRLARIDFRIEVEVYPGPLPSSLGAVFGTPAGMREQALGIRLGKLTGEQAVVTQCAVLLTVRYPGRAEPGWVVLIKPRVRSDAPMDVQQYALTHPAFPQEPTADQFFDEAQWESYRKLGLCNAQAVLSHAVLAELQTLMQEDLGQA